mmetsp:Transcript_440/g.1713  ORF Transcript_440/g.1713 Transcript_440/m.1713 type:complete len:92 (-) Transcript_440:188-463(-)
MLHADTKLHCKRCSNCEGASHMSRDLVIVLRWQNSPCLLNKELKIYFDWRKKSTYCYVQMLVVQLCVISVARTTMKTGIRVLWFSVSAEES